MQDQKRSPIPPKSDLAPASVPASAPELLGTEAVAGYQTALRQAWGSEHLEDRANGCAAALAAFLRRAEPVTVESWRLAGLSDRHRLLADEQQGWIQMVHVYDRGHATPPHDHGTGWVVYGVLTGDVEISTYRSAGPSSVERLTSRLFAPGTAEAYLPGQIHSTRTEAPDGAIVFRFLSEDLARLQRGRWDWGSVAGGA